LIAEEKGEKEKSDKMEVSPDYGFVILVGFATFLLDVWLSWNVGKGRQIFNVPYPKMYSDKEEKFNCYQRAHQNTLEILPFFLMALFIGGLFYPIVASVLGGLWIVGRVLFAEGYYTGDPKNRTIGFRISFLALAVMMLIALWGGINHRFSQGVQLPYLQEAGQYFQQAGQQAGQTAGQASQYASEAGKHASQAGQQAGQQAGHKIGSYL
jgi:glutathione S-transferase